MSDPDPARDRAWEVGPGASRRGGGVRGPGGRGRDRGARVADAVRRFVSIEASGGIVLLGATLVALAWASSPWKGSYSSVWHRHLEVLVGPWRQATSPVHLVNDGLMAVFFFVIGLELRREWTVGELRDRRAALLPAVAALGGMVVPALLFTLVVAGGPGAHGWGIPMATDIAFALGVVALLGRRVPPSLKVFLLTLAIVDDVGAIVVIAVFYAGALRWEWLAAALVGVGCVPLLIRARVRVAWPYVALGVLVWFATWQSGVHATLAGVAFGLLAPPGVGERLAARLHPWSSFVVVPVFALANAGVALGGGWEGHARVGVAVAVGLVAGKAIGVAGTVWLAVRVGVADLPRGASWRELVGVALLAGIGFTMSLFVTDLAFASDPAGGPLATAATLGILLGSVVAASAGGAVLLVRRSGAHA